MIRPNLDAIFESVTERAIQRLVRRYRSIVGIIVDGSVGRGQPSRFSDVDILVVMPAGRTPDWLQYFDEHIYVSVGFVGLNKFREIPKDFKEFYWSRGGAFSARILYDPNSTLKRLIERRKKAKASAAILETALWDAYNNIIEYSGKLRNGWIKRDDHLTRYAARIIAQHSEAAVIALNDLSPISENLIWGQVMRAKKVPPHFKTDYPPALSIKGVPSTKVVFLRGLRLAKETLRLIREKARGVAHRKRFRDLLQEPLEKHGL